MNCTGCNACRVNGGHCKYEDEYLDMPVVMRDKREMVCVDKQVYEEMKEVLKQCSPYKEADFGEDGSIIICRFCGYINMKHDEEECEYYRYTK